MFWQVKILHSIKTILDVQVWPFDFNIKEKNAIVSENRSWCHSQKQVPCANAYKRSPNNVYLHFEQFLIRQNDFCLSCNFSIFCLLLALIILSGWNFPLCDIVYYPSSTDLVWSANKEKKKRSIEGCGYYSNCSFLLMQYQGVGEKWFIGC